MKNRVAEWNRMGRKGWQETDKQGAIYKTSKALVLFGHTTKVF